MSHEDYPISPEEYLDGVDIPPEPEAPSEEYMVKANTRRYRTLRERQHLFQETLKTREALLSQFFERAKVGGMICLLSRGDGGRMRVFLGYSPIEADENWHEILVRWPTSLSQYINERLDEIEADSSVE